MIIWPYGQICPYGHNPHELKYGHDGYLWKEHEKTNSPVKELGDLDIWVKSYGQECDYVAIWPNMAI